MPDGAAPLPTVSMLFDSVVNLRGRQYQFAYAFPDTTNRRCYRCRFHFDGAFVYVFECAYERGCESKKLLWCSECVQNVLGATQEAAQTGR